MYDDEDEDGAEPYSREDYEADQADRKLKMMKEDGSYWRWRESGLSHSEWERREVEDAYERGKAAHAKRLVEERRWDGPDA